MPWHGSTNRSLPQARPGLESGAPASVRSAPLVGEFRPTDSRPQFLWIDRGLIRVPAFMDAALRSTPKLGGYAHAATVVRASAGSSLPGLRTSRLGEGTEQSRERGPAGSKLAIWVLSSRHGEKCEEM